MMEKLELGTLSVGVDVKQTRELYHSLEEVDPDCCIACATFRLALDRQTLPRDLLTFMAKAGITSSRPVDVWGAPERGFLQVWWEYVGQVPDDSAQDVAFEVAPGLSTAITMHHPASDWASAHGERLPALELTWEGESVKAIEREAAAPKRNHHSQA